PAPDAPWLQWLAWLSWASHRVGAYESALSLADLDRLTRGLRQLCLQLEAEAAQAQGGLQETTAGAAMAAALHRQHVLTEASQQCDEARLLVGTLAQRIRGEQAEGLPLLRRIGVSTPDRLRQQVRSQLQLLQATLDRLGEPRGGPALVSLPKGGACR
ncbi:hypothetical protein, partial [Thermogemmatispora tikiterensis]|uniref:hypothetical protein n=1 Tax=Thermogemmatispora tikiterensis TaxID=1825093 RepID=UPI001679257B